MLIVGSGKNNFYIVVYIVVLHCSGSLTEVKLYFGALRKLIKVYKDIVRYKNRNYVL